MAKSGISLRARKPLVIYFGETGERQLVEEGVWLTLGYRDIVLREEQGRYNLRMKTANIVAGSR